MYAAENARFAANVEVPEVVFSAPTVVLELPRRAVSRPDAATAFMLAANLLSRIFTKLYLVAPGLPPARIPTAVPATAAAIRGKLSPNATRHPSPASTSGKSLIPTS